eukprot:NODE_13_length_54415_cov_0.522424.p6 type:complete len:562 gc:universal NODE_13_length_54415_cov_0.522424:28134-29819(+)
MGAADVVMPLVTGETWLKVPEVLEIRFVGTPNFGIGGKDVILYVLGQLKRNTVAHERCVEYTGEGLKYLSCDARFAIANMTTEFGGIAACVSPDEVTYQYIEKRSNKKFRNQDALYMKPDSNCTYAESFTIDLAKVESLVALFPSPDNVVTASSKEGMKLDGLFIGACTTGEEDLILGALVLEAALNMKVNIKKGKKKVTPGSVPILAKLRKLGLIDIYEKAGFEIGSPGCSYCLGIAADKAGDGEVWLSSQNRNFRNRMGKGSIANLASAATVAASSLFMQVTDPKPYLEAIDKNKFHKLMKEWTEQLPTKLPWKDPNPEIVFDEAVDLDDISPTTKPWIIKSKVQRFGDHIDTDAIIPAEFMPGKDDLDLGTHCFEYVRPEFRQKAKEGFQIVVGGYGFGSGSSREEAPRSLNGSGIQAVIARSYAFIYARNQPNMALLGITLDDEEFYKNVEEGAEIEIDVPQRKILVHRYSQTSSANSPPHIWSFKLSQIEESLLKGGGVTQLYQDYGNNMFRAAMTGLKMKKCPPEQFLNQDPLEVGKQNRKDVKGSCDTKETLNW